MIKIFLTISTIANLILIASVVGLYSFLLTSALIIITILIWYIRKMHIQMNGIEGDFNDFYSKMEAYEKHIDEIHGLEMFYGDETLQGLIKHSRKILNDIYDFQIKYFIEEEEQEFDTEKTPEAQQEESVLYRNTSEGDR